LWHQGTPPISTPLANPPYQPLPSHPTSLESQGTPCRTLVMDGVHQPRRPWLIGQEVNVPGDQHDFPKHPEKFFPNLTLDNRESPEDHINKFMLSLSLMRVEEEYVVCRLFPYTF
jgi:hypothetical protein